MARNKKWSSAVKFEIVLSVIKNETPLSEICKRYEVAPSQVHAWKKQLIDHGAQVFSKNDKAAAPYVRIVVASAFEGKLGRQYRQKR